MLRMLSLAVSALAGAALALVLIPVAALAAAGDAIVTVQLGDVAAALAPIAQALLTLAAPLLAALLVQAVAKVAPWAVLFISQARLQQMVQAVTDYGLNAVAGAAKGKVLTVPVGSAVIAAGVQYALENVPARVVVAAGGAEGIARLIFRALHLEDDATEANTLLPAIGKAA